MSDAEGVNRRLRRANRELREILERLEGASPGAPTDATPDADELRQLRQRAWELADEIERLIGAPADPDNPTRESETPPTAE